uniref:Uncharacterized protein n=1 Tax=Cairina moschata TaxID=8855 RepID=A0A8C3BBH4_CAIMO
MAVSGGSAASVALRGLIQQLTTSTGEAQGGPGPLFTLLHQYWYPQNIKKAKCKKS